LVRALPVTTEQREAAHKPQHLAAWQTDDGPRPHVHIDVVDTFTLHPRAPLLVDRIRVVCQFTGAPPREGIIHFEAEVAQRVRSPSPAPDLVGISQYSATENPSTPSQLPYCPYCPNSPGNEGQCMQNSQNMRFVRSGHLNDNMIFTRKTPSFDHFAAERVKGTSAYRPFPS
jgi:hypothetical protein